MKFINIALMMGAVLADDDYEKCSIENTDCSKDDEFCMLILPTWHEDFKHKHDEVIEVYKAKYTGGYCMKFDDCPAFQEDFMKDLKDPEVGKDKPVTDVMVNCLAPGSMGVAIFFVVLPIFILAWVLYCKANEKCCFVDEEKVAKEKAATLLENN